MSAEWSFDRQKERAGMRYRGKAVDIAAKLPLADLMTTIDHAYADYVHSRMETIESDCRCSFAQPVSRHASFENGVSRRVSALVAENGRLRRAISDLTHHRR